MNTFQDNMVSFVTTEQSQVQTAIVTSVDSGKMCMLLGEEIIYAKKAFSCFIEPEPEDRVLCCNSEGEYYIVAIIERKQKAGVSLSFPSDVTVKSQKGAITVGAQNTITMAAKKLNYISQEVVHKSNNATVAYDSVVAHGKELSASYKTVRLLSNLIHTMAKQVVDRFKGYIRKTEDNDQINAGQMTRNTSGLYSMDSKHTIMVSKKDTKIDGERIHMG